MRPARPPQRRCPSCGATFYAWQTHGVCRRCLAGREPIADTLGQIRLERWAAKGLLPPAKGGDG